MFRVQTLDEHLEKSKFIYNNVKRSNVRRELLQDTARDLKLTSRGNQKDVSVKYVCYQGSIRDAQRERKKEEMFIMLYCTVLKLYELYINTQGLNGF